MTRFKQVWHTCPLSDICKRSDCEIPMQTKGKWLSSAQEGLHTGGALGGVQETMAAQMALDTPDAPHLHQRLIYSGSIFRKKKRDLNDEKIRGNTNRETSGAGNSLGRVNHITVAARKAYIHKGETENNEALVTEPGGNREEEKDDKYRRRHTDIQIIKS